MREFTSRVNMRELGLSRGGTTIKAGGGQAPPPFTNFSVFTVLTPPPSNALTPFPFQIRGAALGAIPCRSKLICTCWVTGSLDPRLAKIRSNVMGRKMRLTEGGKRESLLRGVGAENE